jgi:uncharacterized membrane protein
VWSFLGIARREVRSSLVGLGVLALAVVSAITTGEARGYFLPSIFFHIVYALVFAGSVMVRRPVAGVVLAMLRGRRMPEFLADRKRAFDLITIMWAVKFAIMAIVLGALYSANQVGALLSAQLILAWPTNAALFVLSMVILTRFPSSSRNREAQACES